LVESLPEASSVSEAKAALLKPTSAPVFARPVLEDAQWAIPLLAASKRMGCDYAFGNIYAWNPLYKSEITQYQGFFLSRSISEKEHGLKPEYCFPIGDGDLRVPIEAMRRDAAELGYPLRMYGLTEADKDRLEAIYPGEFEYHTDRDSSDYIYTRRDLANLTGKKYHHKRTHLTAFFRENQWEYSELLSRDASLEGILDLAKEWEQENQDNENKDPERLEMERVAIKRFFKNMEAFGGKGAVLKSGGNVVAFCGGEELYPGVFCTHFEKASSKVRGAYQAINNLFAVNSLEGYEYINREEDVGDEGLRQAKLSYRPVILLDKWVATEIRSTAL
jgi:hypothetical protein